MSTKAGDVQISESQAMKIVSEMKSPTAKPEL